MRLMVAILLSAITVMAHAKNNNDNFPNGKPFQKLKGMIETNAQEIEALQLQTADLESEVGSLRSDVDANNAEIDALFDRVIANESDIASLSAEIDQTRTILAAEIAALETDVDAINTVIGDLETELDDLRATLASTRAALLDEIEANGDAIDSLVAQIGLLNSAILIIDGEIADLQTLADSLGDSLSNQAALIAELDLLIAALESRVTDLEPEVVGRTFTLEHTPDAGFTDLDMVSGFQSLELSVGDFLYILGTSETGETLEFCGNNPALVESVNNHINNGSRLSRLQRPAQPEAYSRVTGEGWRALDSWIWYLTNDWISNRTGNMRSFQIHSVLTRPEGGLTGRTLLAEPAIAASPNARLFMTGVGGTQRSMTFAAGASRQEACGF